MGRTVGEQYDNYPPVADLDVMPNAMLSGWGPGEAVRPGILGWKMESIPDPPVLDPAEKGRQASGSNTTICAGRRSPSGPQIHRGTHAILPELSSNSAQPPSRSMGLDTGALDLHWFWSLLAHRVVD